MTVRAVAAASGPAKTAIPDNRFHIGDCLPVLADLAAKHGEFADLVYLDPPFNSKRFYNHVLPGAGRAAREKVAFRDKWEWTLSAAEDFRKFTEKEAPKTGGARFLSAMRGLLEPGGKKDNETLAYLTYMTRRLAVIRAVMKPNASVYLHCDPTAGHYLKLAMDAVFGRDNFRNDISWCYSNSGRSKTRFAAKHDMILFYRKTSAAPFSGRIPVPPDYLESHYRQTDKDGRRCRIRVDAGKRRIYYPEDGITPNDWWEDISSLNSQAAERLGYPTQKPVALLRRILEASSAAGDLILDPFCGCGTTIAACYELERRFIGIDVARSAAQVVARRMSDQYKGFGALRMGGKTPDKSEGWNAILPERDEQDEVPEWARFQYAVIAMIPKAEQIEGKIQRTARRGADGGIDGRLYISRPDTGVIDSIVIQAKRKKQPSVADVADTLAAVDNNNAFMGLLITLNPPTAGMRERALQAPQRRLAGKNYPKVVILTHDEVKAEKFREVLPYGLAVDIQVGSQAGLDLQASARISPRD